MTLQCTTCKYGPSENKDSAYCPNVGHVIYHTTPACKQHTAPTTPPGYTRMCGACGSRQVNAAGCLACGTTWEVYR